MRKRWRWWTLAGLVALLAASGFLLLRPDPSSQIMEANVQRIHCGMSQPEVEAILGPPGDYTTGPVRPTDDGSWIDVSEMYYRPIPQDGPAKSVSRRWACDTGYAEVYFDRDCRVIDADFQPYAREPQGLIDNLLWRAERRWRHWFPDSEPWME